MFEKIRKTNRYSREFSVKDMRAEKHPGRPQSRPPE